MIQGAQDDRQKAAWNSFCMEWYSKEKVVNNSTEKGLSRRLTSSLNNNKTLHYQVTHQNNYEQYTNRR